MDDLRIYNFALSQSEIIAIATYSDVKGDVDGNGEVNLTDGIVSLLVLSGKIPSNIRRDYPVSGADVDGGGGLGWKKFFLF